LSVVEEEDILALQEAAVAAAEVSSYQLYSLRDQ
jgi:hypothetical protein